MSSQSLGTNALISVQLNDHSGLAFIRQRTGQERRGTEQRAVTRKGREEPSQGTEQQLKGTGETGLAGAHLRRGPDWGWWRRRTTTTMGGCSGQADKGRGIREGKNHLLGQ